ncbi:hypothetical protein [Halothece sp. PCC 7418]|uniref:hypothetical protein n=1 Tax=Halothece sp. (strain PCC 7418) TaxID=65093 RepID=UPI0014943D47|nr:hypothetical protein [Halothece sp. PCC 7418]
MLINFPDFAVKIHTFYEGLSSDTHDGEHSIVLTEARSERFFQDFLVCLQVELSVFLVL